MKKPRYSAHIQLQYLIQKYNIDTKLLLKEMSQYYGHPGFSQIKTKTNKVIRIELREDIQRPLVQHDPLYKKAHAYAKVNKGKVVQGNGNSKTAITYKKKRVVDEHNSIQVEHGQQRQKR